MAAEITPITESDRELLEKILDRIERLEAEHRRLLGAWAAGGLRGLRQAARDD